MAIPQPLYCKPPQGLGPQHCVNHPSCVRENSPAPPATPARILPFLEVPRTVRRAPSPSDTPRISIDRWPPRQRPREKLLERGPLALSDSELLAVLLSSGPRGQSAVDLGQALLARFGSIHGLLSAVPRDIRAVRGVGAAKQAQLLAVMELARRALAEQLRDDTTLDSPHVVRNYLRLFIGARSYEVFVCLFLDSRHRLLRAEESSRGTLTHTAVYPREIAREALAQNAASLIVAHNHPSGEAHPSAADRHLTRRLSETLQLIEVKLLDHLIVGANAVFSFAESGLL